MKKVRRWFDKTGQEVGLRPLTSEDRICDETLFPAPQQQDAPSLDTREQLQRTIVQPIEGTGGLGVMMSQVEQVTWEAWRTHDIIHSNPERGGFLPARLLKTTNSSLPSSPLLDKRSRRLPSSLPASPLLGGRTCITSGDSKLWIEAALQRSKNIQRTNVSAPPPPARGGEWEWDFCQLTSCKCLRCPSAPPFEEEIYTAPPHGVRLYPSLSLWKITGEAQEIENTFPIPSYCEVRK